MKMVEVAGEMKGKDQAYLSALKLTTKDTELQTMHISAAKQVL